MFCTTCGSYISDDQDRCRSCGSDPAGAPGAPGTKSRRGLAGPSPPRRFARVLLALVPVAIALLLAAGVTRYDQNLNAKRDAAYDRSVIAFETGDFIAAQSGFAALGDYRDADARLAEVMDVAGPAMAQLQEAEASYAAGDYEAAIEILDGVIAEAPGYQLAGALRTNAEEAFFKELLLDARLAETNRDWITVERSLTQAVSLAPDDVALSSRLEEVWSNHSPLVYTRDGAVFISGPQGDDERALTTNIKAKWPSWSPNRDRIAFIVPTEGGSRFDGTLMTMNADGTDVASHVDRVLPFGAPQWSPDGRFVAYPSVKDFNEDQFVGRISLQMLDVESGVETDLTGERLSHSGGASWSPDGSRIAFVSFAMERRRGGGVDLIDGDAYVVDVKTLELTNLTQGRIKEENWIRWSPAGDQLLLLTNPGDWSDPKMMQLFLLDGSGTGIERQIATDWQLSIPSWSPDGSRFAYVVGGDTIRIWSEQGEEWLHLTGQLAPYLSWSPDGSKLIAPSGNPPQPSYIVSVVENFGEIHAVRIDADGLSGGNGAPMWGPSTIAGQSEEPG